MFCKKSPWSHDIFHHGRVEYPLRGLGIGTALVQQSLHLAVESGCGHYFSALTTPQSQNIFVHKLGYVLRCFAFGKDERMADVHFIATAAVKADFRINGANDKYTST